MGGHSIIIHNKWVGSKVLNMMSLENFLKKLQKNSLPIANLSLIVKAIIIKKNGSNIMIVYHAKCLSPIEAIPNLSFLLRAYLHQDSMINSPKYDIAVIYCIFNSISDIRYRS